MREILFKAKRIDNREWEIGSLVVLPNEEYEIANKCQNPPDSDPMWNKCVITHNVDPSTICQFTGLIDKNGQKIWENDVVKVNTNKGNTLCEVRYADSVAQFQLWQIVTLPKTATVLNLGNYEEEVISNIFDNPELLNE